MGRRWRRLLLWDRCSDSGSGDGGGGGEAVGEGLRAEGLLVNSGGER